MGCLQSHQHEKQYARLPLSHSHDHTFSSSSLFSTQDLLVQYFHFYNFFFSSSLSTLSFSSSSSLTAFYQATTFNQDISKWVVSQVTDMAYSTLDFHSHIHTTILFLLLLSSSPLKTQVTLTRKIFSTFIKFLLFSFLSPLFLLLILLQHFTKLPHSTRIFQNGMSLKSPRWIACSTLPPALCRYSVL